MPMQRWLGFWVLGALVLALVAGVLIQPDDSRTNLNNAAWQALYFDNTDLEGEPVLSRYERTLNYNWSEDAPLGLPGDNFSARWVGKFSFAEGTWNFIAGADDGLRLWVDEVLLIDQWEAGDQFNTYSATLALKKGDHTVTVEYYDATGLAGITVRWELLPPSNATGNNQNNRPASPTAPPLNIATPSALGHVASGVLNVYNGPGIQYDRIGEIFLYQKFPIIGKNQDGSWYLLDLRDGRTGWVSADFLFRTGTTEIPVIIGSRTDQISEEAALALSEVTLREDPGVQGQIIGMIAETSQLHVLGRSGDSNWFLVRYGELEGWAFGLNIQLKNKRAYELPIID